MNQVLFYFSWINPQGGIAESYGRYVFNFIRSCQNVFQNGHTIFCPHQQCVRVLVVCSMSTPIPGVCGLFFSHLPFEFICISSFLECLFLCFAHTLSEHFFPFCGSPFLFLFSFFPSWYLLKSFNLDEVHSITFSFHCSCFWGFKKVLPTSKLLC